MRKEISRHVSMDGCNVSVEMAFLLEAVRTPVAMERSFVGMLHACVFRQTVFEGEGRWALITGEVAFFAMNAADVFVQVSSLYFFVEGERKKKKKKVNF